MGRPGKTRAAAAAVIMLMVAVSAGGCGTTAAVRQTDPKVSAIDQENQRIRPIVEKMAENARQLKEVYKALHADAADMLAESQDDEQLAHIQKVYLIVDVARTISYYQWQLFSVVHYISPERRKDYFTLRARGIADARSEQAHMITLLEVYQAFITYAPASATIDRATGMMRGNLYLYDQMLDVLQPLAHPAGAFTPDPYDPIAYP